jgi:uncharacterized protein (TIGR02117 family)
MATLEQHNHQISMGLIRLSAVILLVALCMSLIASAQAHEPQPAGKSIEVYVVQQAWHTGIVLKTADMNADDWPELIYYSHYNYVEFGWGDEAFYQSDDRLVWRGARAVLWPTSSAILLVGYNQHPHERYGVSGRIMRLVIDHKSFSSLSKKLSESFARDEQGKLINSTYRGESKVFFEAVGHYHLFNTCNTRVARLFRESGFSVRTRLVLAASQLFRQLGKLQEAAWV